MDALPFLCGDSVMTDQTNGAISYQTNINCNVVAIDAPAPKVSIYPNPGHEQVTLTGIQQVTVFAADGRRIGTFSSADPQELRIPVAKWSPGIYLFTHEKGSHRRVEE